MIREVLLKVVMLVAAVLVLLPVGTIVFIKAVEFWFGLFGIQ